VHLQLAHTLWASHLKKSDSVVDATIGNGHDFVYLASLLGPDGALTGFDIQKEALKKTRLKLAKVDPPLPQITLHHACHSTLKGACHTLIVYNLGYLPGGDKSITTQVASTIESLEKGLRALSEGGALSIMTYPGHEEGAREHEAVLEWLEKKNLLIFHFYRTDRRRSPHLLFAKTKKLPPMSTTSL
jgi:hypothetical protein